MSDTPKSAPPAIHAAIVAVIDALPAIGKERKVSGGGPSYQYRGIEDILPHLRTAFIAHGVHVAPVFRLISDSTYTVRSGAEWRRVLLEGRFAFTSVSDGSTVETVTLGEATDSGDKATNKAMTAAYKYAIIQTFALAEADDPDAVSSAESEAAAPAAETPAPAAAEQPDGKISLGDAKKEFLDACDGDKECAAQAWAAHGEALPVEDQTDADGVLVAKWVPVADVLAAVAAFTESREASK